MRWKPKSIGHIFETIVKNLKISTKSEIFFLHIHEDLCYNIRYGYYATKGCYYNGKFNNARASWYARTRAK